MQMIRSIEEADFSGKRVLLRASLNVPVDAQGNPTDEFRLHQALRTIDFLSKGGAKVVIIAHLGREGDTLQGVAKALQKIAGKVRIGFSDAPLAEAVGLSQSLLPGECLLLENVRKYPGEEKNDPALAQELAALCDLFVNDAFADSHRAHASIVGVAALRPSYAGLLMCDEVFHLSKALTPPKGAIAIIGGAKFETKQPLIEKLLRLYEKVCVAGALANDFLKARGLPVGLSLVSDIPVPQELARDPRILIQSDAIVLNAGAAHECASDDVTSSDRIVDAGPRTAEEWSEEIQRAPFVLWNGPTGIYEEGFTSTTDTLAEAIVRSSVPVAVGGGDTLAALQQFSFDESRVFRSTGGGAMLQFLADGTLPGIKVLEK